MTSRERRSFLCGAAATSALALCGRTASSSAVAAPRLELVLEPAPGASRAGAKAAKPARLRVGFQIFSWGRYFPVNWWKGAEAVAAIGYRGVEGEYTIAELYEGREGEFTEKMGRLGVSLAALYSSSDLENSRHAHENLRKNLHAAAFCKRAGGRMLVIGGMEAHDRAPALYQAYAKAANELGKRTLEEYGVRCGFHPHVGALVQSRDEIARVMDATDPRYFFLAPDTGHLLAGGSDPVEIFRAYASRIVHAHLKDYRPAPMPGARGSFQPLGQGQIDFPALVKILTQAGFDGWLDVELDRTQDPEQVARDAKDYIQNRLGLRLDAGADTAASEAKRTT